MPKPMHRQHFKRADRSRGVALITALLLLSVLMVMTLSMVIATTSDTLIDGYYRNARGSFYAADSGINAARQYLINQFNSSVTSPYTAYSTPISTGTETTILSRLNNTTSGFGAYRSVIGTQSSWKGSFIVDSANTTLGAPTCQIHYTSSTGTIPTCTNAGNGSATWYQYSYPYKLTVVGRANASATNTVEEQGTILLTVTINSSTTSTTNFAAYGMFIDQSPICNGSTLVPGTISGPVFTNGAWNFGTSGSYIFTDAVKSHSGNIGYQFSSCYQSANTSYTSGSQTIHPTFQSGITLGASSQTMPGDSYDQAWAAIDGIGLGESSGTAPSHTDMNSLLRNYNNTAAYPLSGAASGVYLPISNSATTCSSAPCITGGGIYVEGNASVTITSTGTTGQVYTIVQGANTTVVTITNDPLNPGTGTTKIQLNGGATTTINGVPVQKDSSGNTQRNATMLYVDGNITALKGGGQGVGTIQDSTALNVVANGSVTITGDILYKNEPVTLTQSGSTPADTLIPANNHGQSLGIYTSNGNINLANAQSNGNLEIDASIAAIANNQSYTLVNTGNAINTLTIVGGRIQDALGNINSTTRNVWFDRRYAQGGFAPPWFPSTTNTTTTTYATPVPVITASRTSWVNTTAQ